MGRVAIRKKGSQQKEEILESFWEDIFQNTNLLTISGLLRVIELFNYCYFL